MIVRRESSIIDYHGPFDQAFRELKQTTTAAKTTANKKGLMSRTLVVHVRYKSLYISRASTAEQQREMTKFCALWRTWASTAVISYFVLEFSLGAHISVWVSPSDTVWCAEKVQIVTKVNCNSLKSSTSLKVPNYTGPDLTSLVLSYSFPALLSSMNNSW